MLVLKVKSYLMNKMQLDVAITESCITLCYELFESRQKCMFKESYTGPASICTAAWLRKDCTEFGVHITMYPVILQKTFMGYASFGVGIY